MIGKVIRRLAAEARECRRWQALSRPDDIRVYYGMDRLPTRDEPVSGGIVKFLDLAERFPNAPDSPNLLYLVSSALPDRRELLARAAQRAGGRFVLNQNGVAYPAWAGKNWQTMNAPNARVYTMADFVVYQSEFCRVSAERHLGERKGPSEVLYNPVDTDVFTPAANKRDDDGPVLLAAGSHHAFSRVQIPIDVLSALAKKWPSARLIIAGRLRWRECEAQAEQDLQEYSRTKGVEERVTWLGGYSQEDAPDVLRRADALVHAKYNDPCPRLVVEAMACGLPVAYSASGGVTELVGDEAGVGVPAPLDWDDEHTPSSEAMTEAVGHILDNRTAYAQSARERAVQRFNVRNWCERHRAIFASLV